MSYMLPHLHNGWQVDQAILSEEDRVLVIRFGHDWDPTCMKMDEVLYSIAEKVKNFAVIYLVDITEVPDFNKMYELYDPCTVMFFFSECSHYPYINEVYNPLLSTLKVLSCALLDSASHQPHNTLNKQTRRLY
uniref:Thioredoxin-like 4A n=1 Tax=Astatotilapia calliptera TaxID=8154 RepID=A0AAX7UFM2_ASTCA